MSGRLIKSEAREARSSRVVAAIFAAIGLVGFLVDGRMAWLAAGLVMSGAFLASAALSERRAADKADKPGEDA